MAARGRFPERVARLDSARMRRHAPETFAERLAQLEELRHAVTHHAYRLIVHDAAGRTWRLTVRR